MAHAGGRPLKFKTLEELKSKIDKYFVQCDPHVKEVTEYVQARDKSGKLLKDDNGLSYLVKVTHLVKTVQVPYTVTGLALALDTSRRTLLDYQEKDEYSHTIKEAKDKVESYLEMNLNGTSPTGTIFNLKNNFEWRDKTETDLTNNGGTFDTPTVRIIDERISPKE